jgi:hypothetical protein
MTLSGKGPSPFMPSSDMVYTSSHLSSAGTMLNVKDCSRSGYV